MELLIWRDRPIETVRFGHVVDHPRFGAMVVRETRETADGVELYGVKVGHEEVQSRRHGLSGKRGMFVRVLPTAAEQATVFEQLLDAVSMAARAYEDEQDGGADGVKERAPWDAEGAAEPRMLRVGEWLLAVRADVVGQDPAPAD